MADYIEDIASGYVAAEAVEQRVLHLLQGCMRYGSIIYQLMDYVLFSLLGHPCSYSFMSMETMHVFFNLSGSFGVLSEKSLQTRGHCKCCF